MALIYKYCRFDKYAESRLAGAELFLNHPAGFNDPFDCRPWLDFNYSAEQLVRGLASQLRRQAPHLTHNDAVAQATGIFLNGRHRNPRTWEALRADLIATVTCGVGVLCLTELPDSILMWAHYGDDHKGFCLGFEWSEYTPFFGSAQQVRYQDALPHIDVFNAEDGQQVDLLFLTKFTDWQHEREWRIVDPESGPGLQTYPEELLRTVIFGCRTKDADRDNAIKWLSRRSHRPALSECILDQHEYKLILRPIE